MASTVADNVSRPAAPLSFNPSKNPLRLRARAAMIASAYTYWYLTATPDLLRVAGARFAPDGMVGGEP